MDVRKWSTHVERLHDLSGNDTAQPLQKAAVAAVVKNPYAGRVAASLEELLEPSAALAKDLVSRCAATFDTEVQSCGKAAVVGEAGEQEHGVACLTTPFGDALREEIGGQTWVTSNTKVGGSGTPIDVPLAYKQALFVREFYDTLTVSVPDAPLPDEIVVIVAMADRGRLYPRTGGLRKEEVIGDGLR